MEDGRFLISSWDQDLDDLDETRNPTEPLQKEILSAAGEGNLDRVKELIESDISLLHVSDKDGYTPLHRACHNNSVPIVEYLIQMGADVSMATDMKWQPLHSCCLWNHTECALRLIQQGADVNARTEGGQTPLHIAATHAKCYDMVQLLMMHPYIKPQLKNNSNETAQENAIRKSKYYKIFDMGDPLVQGILD